MPETSAVPVAPEAIEQAAPVEGEVKKVEPIVDDPYEFELDVKGQKQKLKFKDKNQLTAILQKATYADSVIKESSQKIKATEALMSKLRTPQGLKEIMADPAIGQDYKKFALSVVQEMMDDEKLTPEQREHRDTKSEYEKLKAEKAEREAAETQRLQDEKNKAFATEIRTEIIGAMKKYPEIPQTQATMDACILNMRAAFKKFGKHLTADQAMTVYNEQYWKSLESVLDKMTPEQILARFGKKTLDKIQKLKLDELKKSTDPKSKVVVGSDSVKKKKHITEKEFEKHFQELAGGL